MIYLTVALHVAQRYKQQVHTYDDDRRHTHTKEVICSKHMVSKRQEEDKPIFQRACLFVRTRL